LNGGHRAQAYTDVIRVLQSLLQCILRERPEDPFAYMIQMLQSRHCAQVGSMSADAATKSNLAAPGAEGRSQSFRTIDTMEQGPLASSTATTPPITNKTTLLVDNKAEDSACTSEELLKDIVIDDTNFRDPSIVWEPVLPPQTPGSDPFRTRLQCPVSTRAALPSEQLPDVRLRRGPNSRFNNSIVPALSSRRCPLTPVRLSPRVPASPFEHVGGHTLPLRTLDNSCLRLHADTHSTSAPARNRSTQGHGAAVGSARNAASQLGEERRGLNTPLLSLAIPKLTVSRGFQPQKLLKENRATKNDLGAAEDARSHDSSAPREERPEGPSLAKDVKMEDPCIVADGKCKDTIAIEDKEASERSVADTGTTQNDGILVKDANSLDSSAVEDVKPDDPSITKDAQVQATGLMCLITDESHKPPDATEDTSACATPTDAGAARGDTSAAKNANAELASALKDDKSKDPRIVKDKTVEELLPVTNGECKVQDATEGTDANAAPIVEAGATLEDPNADKDADGEDSCTPKDEKRGDTSIAKVAKVEEPACTVTDGKCKGADATRDAEANASLAAEAAVQGKQTYARVGTGKGARWHVAHGQHDERPEEKTDLEDPLPAVSKIEVGKTERQLAGSCAIGRQSAKFQAASHQDASVPEDGATAAQDERMLRASVQEKYNSGISEVATNCSSPVGQVARHIASECRASLTSQWGA